MITIEIDGKMYQPRDIITDKNMSLTMGTYIEDGILEEVKENKETLYGRSIEEQIREHLATPSILEKLREMKKDMLYERKREDLDSYESGQLKVIEDLLTSLETPQFTPGQEIECSHTGKEGDWFKEKFTKMVGVHKDLYGVEGEESWYRFARPIKIEPELLKPSERIRQIADEKGIPNNEAVPAWIIASYLDEQALSRQKSTK